MEIKEQFLYFSSKSFLTANHLKWSIFLQKKQPPRMKASSGAAEASCLVPLLF
ncbi:hypothetical protein ANACOL_00697 [Anaerotruncus colihominis DSM 17241]|uniref:Uncharacterized protein n=1 Tax=Anaerotruncus colihominis DSM 17241 TaxID=445972 RepID=B0P7G6_9FIRM|nr:hypothetical protein ANACOL_00697 [Anaerotruncus colihominis DSM 17241]